MPVSKKAGSQIVTVDRRTQNRRNKEASEAEVKAMVAADVEKTKFNVADRLIRPLVSVIIPTTKWNL